MAAYRLPFSDFFTMRSRLDRRVGELQLDAHAGGDLQLTGAFRTGNRLDRFRVHDLHHDDVLVGHAAVIEDVVLAAERVSLVHQRILSGCQFKSPRICNQNVTHCIPPVNRNGAFCESRTVITGIKPFKLAVMTQNPATKVTKRRAEGIVLRWPPPEKR